MNAVSLPSVDEAVTGAQDALKIGRGSIAFIGPPGRGKTTALERLGERLKAEAIPTIALGLHFGDDAAVAALAQLAAQVDGGGAIFREASLSYDQRLDRLLRSVPAQTVILFDEPLLGGTRPEWEETIFSERSREFSTRVLKLDGRQKVLTLPARTMAFQLFDLHPIPVARGSDPEEILRCAGLLDNPDVRALLNSSRQRLSLRSPIEIRLAAQVAVAGSGEGVRDSDFRLEELVGLASRSVTRGVRRALGRLSLVRERISKAWLDWACVGAKSDERSIIAKVFLFGSGPELRLHESIAGLATRQKWLTAADQQFAHREIAQAYRSRFSTAAKELALDGAIRDEVECIHHRTMGADASLLDDTLFFAEQYDVLGRVFGQRGEALFKRRQRVTARRSVAQAVQAYERACANDTADWYAWHYLAFNLDVLGEDLARIEAGYLESLRLRPQFVWGHSRWIRFLITCGRIREARGALNEAVELLVPLGTGAHPSLYAELHLDVARNLLQFGQHEQAKHVLESVPVAVRPQLDRWELLSRYAAFQREADRNESVFPPTANEATRWKRSAFAKEGERVVKFMPGRLASVAGNTYRFRVGLSEGKVGWREASHRELKAMGLAKVLPLPVGAFVEFLTVSVGSKASERVQQHPFEGSPFAVLEIRYPDPSRFLGE